MSNMNDDPRAIEAEIRNTQGAMSRTSDELANQLNPMNLLRSLGNGDGDTFASLKEKAADNPLALALIGAGVAWLLAGPDAKPSTFTSNDDDNQDYDRIPKRRSLVKQRSEDPYLAHMSTVERRDGEQEPDYQRRRDDARGSYFRMERNHDENDRSFRDRLNAASDRMNEKREAMADRASELSSNAGKKRRAATERTKTLYGDNPVVGGLIAMLAGAAAGAAAPLSSKESEVLGEYGEKVRSKVTEKAGAASKIAEDQVHPDRESPVKVNQ